MQFLDNEERFCYRKNFRLFTKGKLQKSLQFQHSTPLLMYTDDVLNLMSLTPLFKDLDVPKTWDFYGSNFRWMPFLPPPTTHMDTSRS